MRLSKGLTAATLGKAVGLSGTQIQRIETGEREFRLEVLLALCGFLGVTADEIVDIPLKGINKAKCDEGLMDSVVGFVLEACEQQKIKFDKRKIAKWTTLVYNDAVNLNLNFKQVRGLAQTVVKAGK